MNTPTSLAGFPGEAAVAPPDFLPAIQLARDALRPVQQHRASWKPRLLAEHFGKACSFCGTPIRGLAKAVSHLVPLSLGGADEPVNWLLTCATCRASRGNLDLLAWPEFAARQPDASVRNALLVRRLAALETSANHRVAEGRGLNARRARAELAERFEHPRTRVFAFDTPLFAYFAWRAGTDNQHSYENVVGVLAGRYGAVPVTLDGHRCFRISSAQLEQAAWDLIALNTWIAPVAVASGEAPLWGEVFHSLNELRRQAKPRDAGTDEVERLWARSQDPVFIYPLPDGTTRKRHPVTNDLWCHCCPVSNWHLVHQLDGSIKVGPMPKRPGAGASIWVLEAWVDDLLAWIAAGRVCPWRELINGRTDLGWQVLDIQCRKLPPWAVEYLETDETRRRNYQTGLKASGS